MSLCNNPVPIFKKHEPASAGFSDYTSDLPRRNRTEILVQSNYCPGLAAPVFLRA